MAEQESGVLSAGSSECNSKCISTDESDSSFSETLKLLAAFETYLSVTQTTCLELKSRCIGGIGVEEAAGVYKLLPNSHVIDLNISCNFNLSGGMEDLIQLLVTSKIKTLSLCCCMISNEELLRLMKVINKTHVTELIIHFDDCGICYDFTPKFQFDSDEKTEFISDLLASRFTRFDFHLHFVQSRDDCSPLLRVVQDTSITNLDLSWIYFSQGVLSSLFPSLPQSAITDLDLSNTDVRGDDLRQLSFNLRDSNVVNLNLARNRMDDAGLDILAEGLAHSKIRSLDISQNSITGSSSFGLYLKDSQISNLDLSYNRITSEKLLSFPHALKHSSLVRLNVGNCELGDKLGQEFVKCLKFSKVAHLNLKFNNLKLSSLSELVLVLKDKVLNHVDITFNVLPSEGVIMLGDCLKDSFLKVIKVGNSVHTCMFACDPGALASFLARSKGTSLETVDLTGLLLRAEGVNAIAASLVDTTFTHLNLSVTDVLNGLVSLAPQLKFTSITHLNLSNNALEDAGAEILANCLMDTKIIHLNLSRNFITDRGAEVLANALKGSKLIYLDLSSNQIGDEGLNILAEHAESTFITNLDLSRNYYGHRKHLLINRILLENQTSVHRFVNFFKQITPETNERNFHFENIIDYENVEIFLEKCLLFYKTVSEQSSAASVLVADDGLSYSMEESVKLLKEEFPMQLAVFFTNRIKASQSQLIGLLKRAEELKLHKIVEFLLLDRPALMIDQDVGIMHPYVYQLLHKYNQPLYNLSIELEGKTKITEYFMEHSDLDGAIDIINLLNRGAKSPKLCNQRLQNTRRNCWNLRQIWRKLWNPKKFWRKR